ncbi:MAG: ComF family protein [Bacteroidia bacterium]|nr:ComF family protein [Bacteroidia bacterium]
MLQHILHLLYPNLCLNCNKSLVQTERYLCLLCQLNLPETNDHLTKENSVEKTMWGRIPFERAFSFLYFNQKGVTQRLLHELKYRGNEELAVYLGEIYAARIKQTAQNHGIDAIVAVPLHASRLKKRGYNQSFAFAEGIAKGLEIENLSSAVERRKATDTQTKKSRAERWKNVSSIFCVTQAEVLQQKHILLVDDVITTGATIESCGQEIIKTVDCTLSIASIAFAA